jgi:hypothetical protein
MSTARAIVLDLGGNGVTTEDLKDAKVRYDWDGDGLADRTSWIASSQGFLFLDRDGDGTVTAPSELSFWPAADGDSGSILSSFDTNHDGLLSSLDADWANFKIWQDKNGNGVVDAGEVLTLAAAGIGSFTLPLTAGTQTPAADAAVTLATGSYTRTNGSSRALAEVSLGFLSAPVDGLPKMDFLVQSFDRKAKKYQIKAQDGQFVVTGKDLDGTDSRAGGLNGATTLEFRNRSFGMLSALVVDLDGNGVSLVRRTKSRALFDMNGDGTRDDTGWISKRDGFLVIDRNNDGRITDASELSFLSEDPSAKNSLAGLGSLDSNGDNILDKKDARFGELKIWVDANGNGVSDPGELKSLAELGIVSIDLNPHNLSRSVKPGENLLLATATFTRENGTVGTIGDAALAFVPTSPAAAPAALATPPDNPLPGTPPAIGTGELPDPLRLPRVPDDMPPTPGLLTEAANQLASAIAAFGPPAPSGEFDFAREMPQGGGIVLAPTAHP